MTPAELLRVLLRRHFTATRIPALLDERFVQIIRRRDEFAGWPVEAIVPDRDAFLAFLQERWPAFLDRVAGPRAPSVGRQAVRSLDYPGPVDLPFDHDDIRVYVDNLFLEGLLHPVLHPRTELLLKTWLVVGLRTDNRMEGMRRFDGLLDTALSGTPAAEARHGDWLRFARTWAELKALRLEFMAELSEARGRDVEALQTGVDAAFSSWIEKRYAELANLPPVPPVMLPPPTACACSTPPRGRGT